MLAAALPSAAHAAVAPVTWCGGTPAATDRPDVVGGDQIHVVYAVPSDGTDRFGTLASAIAADIGAIGSWWRKQDATRSPRFDLAAFSCKGAGSLDISDVRLPHPTAYYNDGTTPRLQLLRDDLLASGLDDPAKKYLVYYEQSQPATGTDCGSAYVNAQSGGSHGYAAVYLAPNLAGCGGTTVAGGYLAVVAAHELINALGALDPATPGPPHRCPGDPLHPCDSTLDVLAPRPTAATLAAAVLDAGHDDYYAHGGTWWDVQDSPWLRRLDSGEERIRVTVGTGGKWVVDTAQPGVLCGTRSCTWTWQSGTELELAATAEPGYEFIRWTGCASVRGDVCAVTADRAQRVTAVFARPLRVAAFHLALSRDRLRLTATVRLNARGRADAVVCGFGGRPAESSSLRAGVATCTWTVASRFRGHRIRGSVELESAGERVLTRPFHVRVPR